ncbi:hypothetical protein DFQ26_001968 [Actinomortierella ambigua]|nr:hypothetical protein DFQ26_001968 [Actinomortierella ambigua]
MKQAMGSMELLLARCSAAHINLTAWLLGGRTAIRQMIDFAAKNNVHPWIEKMPMSDANAAVKHMMEGKPRYRIVMYTDAAKES